MKSIFYSFILLVVFISCKKDSDEIWVSISGIVINSDNNELVADANVYITKYKYIAEHTYYIESIKSTTNKKGEYEMNFSYNLKDAFHRSIRVIKDGYTQKNKWDVNDLRMYKIDQLFNDTLYLGLATHLKINIRNMTDSTGGLSIELNRQIPPELYDSTADYNQGLHNIHYPDSIFYAAFVYQDNPQVYVTWSIYDIDEGDFVENGNAVMQMNLSDTTYLNIEL